MIKISQIDSKLSVYKNNIVILWGVSEHTEKMIDLLNYHKIKIFAICDFNVEKSDKKLNEIDIISLLELKSLSDKGYSLVIQEIPWYDDWELVKEKTKDYNINSYIMVREAWHVLLFKQRYDVYIENPKFVLAKSNNDETIVNVRYEELRDFAEKSFNQPINIICTPYKTGDYTLMETFKSSNIPYIQIWNSSNAFDKEMLGKLPNEIRLFLGVRDPISQNLSWVYQLISTSFVGETEILKGLLEQENNFYHNGGDAQLVWDLWLNKTKYLENSRNEKSIFYDIQGMLQQYTKNIFDFTKYPFDKEKGYSIVKDGNISIFIYQIEKLNNLTEEFTSFTGKKNLIFKNKNNASDKWISNSYKQAKKDLQISKEYFQKCYNESYLKHCYSKEDIEKFKDKWRNNIVK